jgi:hypothetical protein
MFKGRFVALQKQAQLLVGARPVVAPSAVAQGHHEDVQHNGAVAQADPRLAPVDLALLARRGLEAPLAQLRSRHGLLAQRRDESLDRLVTTPITVAAAQLLVENLGRITDSLGTLA